MFNLIRSSMTLVLLMVATYSFAAPPPNIGPVLEDYRAISKALANDEFSYTQFRAGELVDRLGEIIGVEETVGEACRCSKQDPMFVLMRDGATRLSLARTESELRLAMSELSEGTLSFVKNHPDLQQDWQAYMCPMVAEGEYNFWMQPRYEHKMNPYMGLKMPQCGMRKNWNEVPTLIEPSLNVGKVLGGFNSVSKALANDKFTATRFRAENLVVILDEVVEQAGQAHPQYSQLVQMKEGAWRLASTIVEAEQRLAMSALARGAVSFVKSQPELQQDWQAYMCPMVAEGEYNFWMQPKGESKMNPYMGLKMPMCGMSKTWDEVPDTEKPPIDVGQVLDGFNAISTALANDKFLETKTEAEALVVILEEFIEQVGQEHPQYTLFIEMKGGAMRLSSTEKEAELRLAMSALSKGAVSFVKSQPDLQQDWQAYMCPMVAEGEYNFWMQPKGESKMNPYMGLKMLMCGMKKTWDEVPDTEKPPIDVGKVLDGYHAVAKALAHDKFVETKTEAEALVVALEEFIEQVGQEHPQYSQLLQMKEGALRLASTAAEAEQRLAMSALSKGAVSFVKGQPSLQSLWQAYTCPMVAPGEYNFWMQPKSEQMANPYMGLKMLMCGMKKTWNKVP